MKKILTLLIAAISFMTFFAGCSNVTTSADPTQTLQPSASIIPANTPSLQPHTHSYGDWTVLQEPTCIQTGIRICSCSCGDTKKEDIPTIDHNYVNYICTMCKNENMPGKLHILDNLDIDELFYCSKNTVIFGKEHKYYLADHSSKILTVGYDSLKCANSDGYFVAYNFSSEVVDTFDDPDFGTLNTIRHFTDCYVINQNGNIVFSTKYIYTEIPMGKTTYEGEYISSCNEGRIITYTSDTYYFASSHSAVTVNMYNMQGEHLAQFTNVRSVGTLINGELIMLTDDNISGSLLVADNNGKTLRFENNCVPSLFDFTYFPNNTWTSNGFINGYTLITCKDSNAAVLIDSTLTKSYIINGEYLANYLHTGTIVASKIVINGIQSSEYYLVDLTMCKIDENGYCIPTLDAVVSAHGYDDIFISCLFGKTSSYTLVSKDSQWGYLSIDGSFEKITYNDAGNFYDGKAIVTDNNGIYVIDENFNRISDIITGYSAVSSYNGNVFCLRNGDKLTVAVYE